MEVPFKTGKTWTSDAISVSYTHLVFQNYNLLPVLNVYENIVYPIEIDGAKADTEFVRQIRCV